MAIFKRSVMHAGMVYGTGGTYNNRPVEQDSWVKNAHYKALKKVTRMVYFGGDNVFVINIGFFKDVVYTYGKQDHAAYYARNGFIMCRYIKILRAE
jgi:hypothetical protein